MGRGLSIATQLFSVESAHVNQQDQDSLNILQQALQRVFVWQNRWDRIPHSIEISASLAQELLLDFTQHINVHRDADKNIALSNPIPSVSIPFSMVLRSAYASSIVRAVNGIANSMQRHRSSTAHSTTRPSHSLSIANLCSMLGLPSWIVHVRHDATHKELPSLIVLRLTAQTLLTFMIEEYFLQPHHQSLLIQQQARIWLES